MTDTKHQESRTRPHFDTNYWKRWVASVISNLGDGIGIIAYPWIASSVTLNPLPIAGIAVAQRLPWLVFSLPAGVTARYDRRKLMVMMDFTKAALIGVTAIILGLLNAILAGQTAVFVLWAQGMSGSAEEPDSHNE